MREGGRAGGVPGQSGVQRRCAVHLGGQGEAGRAAPPVEGVRARADAESSGKRKRKKTDSEPLAAWYIYTRLMLAINIIPPKEPKRHDTFLYITIY